MTTTTSTTTTSTATIVSSLPSLVRPSSIPWNITETERAKMTPERLIKSFDGQTDPERWIQSILDVARIAGWSAEYSTLVARSKLDGDALHFVEQCNPIGERLTLAQLEAYLVAQYKPKEKLFVRLHKFMKAQQLPDETLTLFAARIRSLGLDTCHTQAEKEGLESRMMAQFVFNLRSKEIIDYLATKEPSTLSEALELALNAESTILAKQTRFHSINHVYARPYENATNRHFSSCCPHLEPCCSWCDDHGFYIGDCHEASFCRRRMRAENLCFICQSPDHFAMDCPDNAESQQEFQEEELVGEPLRINTTLVVPR